MKARGQLAPFLSKTRSLASENFYLTKFPAGEEEKFRVAQDISSIRFIGTLGLFACMGFSLMTLRRFFGALDSTHTLQSSVVAAGAGMTLGFVSAYVLFGKCRFEVRKFIAIAIYFFAGLSIPLINCFRLDVRFDGDAIAFAIVLASVSSIRLSHRCALIWLAFTLSAYFGVQFWMFIHDIGPYQIDSLQKGGAIFDPAKINIQIFLVAMFSYFVFRFNEARERRLFERESKVAKSAQERLHLLQSIGHDLRQPMTAISLHCGLAKGAFLDKNQEQLDLSLNVVAESLDVMNAELTQITEIAEGGSSGSFANQVVNFTQILSRLHEAFSARALSEHIRFSLETPEVNFRVDVFSDPIQLRKVVTNLLSNAFKYAKPFNAGIERTIALNLSYTSSSVRLEVKDSGIGIDAENLLHIWEPFFQVGNPERNRERGFGLGLAHVKSAVDQLPGHSIRVTSSIGIGTTFVLEMPLVTASDDLVVLDPNPIVETRGYSEPADVMKADISGVLVFILEDDAVLRLALVQALQQAGTLTSAASDLRSARELYMSMELIPDVLIVDHRLPDGSGRDFILDINRHAVEFGLTAPPVIYLTGEHSSALKLDDLGNVTLLRKPTDIQTLLRTIASLVNVST
jgi:signal transduction histidine kinase/ActR/RegA family two-component response regulator